MKRIYFLIITVVLVLLSGSIFAQTVKISAEVRPRFEFRHGYKTLIPDDYKAASFISQRTRLNAFYANKNFRVKLSLQDVRVWGDVSQLNRGDVNGTSIHEAWGEVMFSEKFSIKFGRQEIIYDDHRIFGSVAWAQQARSHDAAIIKIKPTKNHRIDIGLAYNANGETLYKTDYAVNSYKTFQYGWYHGNFGNIGVSFLALNNGRAYMDNADTANIVEKIAYSQTIGPRITYKGDKIKANIAFYYQGGKNSKNVELSAMYFGGDISFHLIKGFSFGIGTEYLSGTATNDIGNGKDKSFAPLYGTNHKFNGWMDYFYVGNHGGNVGLTDIYLPLKYKYDKWLFVLIPHYFMSAATVSDATKDYNNGLGTEIDITVKYSLSKAVQFQAGYSQMFATETMQVLKGGNYKNTNNWAWLMITFKPTFFEKK